VLGGSGNGEAIVANRVRGIRCGVCWNEETAKWNRAHNDANVLSIGARTVSLDLALKIVQVWLETPFEGGRHLRRIRKIDGLDRRTQRAFRGAGRPVLLLTRVSHTSGSAPTHPPCRHPSPEWISPAASESPLPKRWREATGV